MVFTLLLVSLGSSFTDLANAGDGYPTLNLSRTILIRGLIANGNLIELGIALEKLSVQDPSSTIDLVINSPGGEVTTGRFFINSMLAAKARGSHIRCFVPYVAASMAFSILTYCDERYTAPNAVLLWHRAAVSLGGGMFSPGVRMTSQEAEYLAQDLIRIDALIIQELLSTVHLPVQVLAYHLDHETLHIGQQLSQMDPSFITSVNFVHNLFEVLVDAKGNKVPVNKSENLNSISRDSIIYVYTK